MASQQINEIKPQSSAEQATAMRKLIDTLTGFIGSGPPSTWRSTCVINIQTKDAMPDRVAYYRGWMSEGTFPRLRLHVLDATSDSVRFPHLLVLTGPRSENAAFLSDNGYETRVTKYVPSGKLEIADVYQDFDMPGYNRLNLDFSRKVLEPGHYVISLILEPG